jgi:hypothetical protein
MLKGKYMGYHNTFVRVFTVSLVNQRSVEYVSKRTFTYSVEGQYIILIYFPWLLSYLLPFEEFRWTRSSYNSSLHGRLLGFTY